MFRRILGALIPIVLLVACSSSASSGEESPGGGGEESAGASSGGGESAAESAAASTGSGSGDGLASIDLTITGGDYAGHYEVDITSGGCSTGATGPGTFAVASVTVDPAEAFGGPQITLYDAAAAANGDDAEFSAAFPFNNYAYTVEVNPYLSASQGSDFGSGTATLDNRGSSATLTIEGTTSAGEEVSATIECHTVTNF
ncbi:MAG TPA: hypothetical protein VFJ00_02205 [Candidatus Limnocylindria bacterium]|nr:hypothetical protein [Candidatus Limnocylindria bacterium]